MDYGRYKYEQAKKENEATQDTRETITLKEIRMRLTSDEHDIEVKTRKIQEFLAEGTSASQCTISWTRYAPSRYGRKLLDGIAEN